MNSRSNSGSLGDAGLEADSRWGLVLRITGSDTFAKSARLRDFLLYVCQAALEDRLEDIHEQKIGERVFGRTENYNASEDNIVRSQARILRLKLDAYFTQEGANEPLTIRIPRGAYVPEFVERHPQSPDATIVSESTIPARSRLISGLMLAVAILSLTVFVLVTLLLLPRHVPVLSHSEALPPALSALWSQLFSEGLTTTVVLPDHTFSLLQEAAGENLDLNAYLKRSLPESNDRLRQFQDVFKQFAQRRYTTYDTLNMSIHALQIADKLHGKLLVRYARDITLHDLTPGHAILIGRSTANPWIELFEPKLNFRVHVDFKTEHAYWANASPQPGEQAEYLPKQQGSRLDGYASLAFLPNLSGGNVLIVTGTGSSSQEGAADLVTTDSLLAKLVEKIGTPGGRLPYFDALFRTTTINEVTQEPSLVAYRVLSK